MSYGWLTESALIPKKSKHINVESNRAFYEMKLLYD